MGDFPDNVGKPLAKTFVVCGVLIEKGGKYLMVQEKKPKVFGLWNLPGGKVDEGETLEEAAIREAKEESGLEVELEREVHVIHQSVESPVIHTFLSRTVGGELNLQEDEIMGADWFSPEEIVAMKSELRNPERIIGALKALEQ